MAALEGNVTSAESNRAWTKNQTNEAISSIEARMVAAEDKLFALGELANLVTNGDFAGKFLQFRAAF